MSDVVIVAGIAGACVAGFALGVAADVSATLVAPRVIVETRIERQPVAVPDAALARSMLATIIQDCQRPETLQSNPLLMFNGYPDGYKPAHGWRKRRR